MTSPYQQFLKEFGAGRIFENIPLEKFSSMRIGGVGDLFFKAGSLNDLVRSFSLVRKLKIPYFLLGGGTNTLFSDQGFRGLVIRNETQGIRLAGIRSGVVKNIPGGPSKRKIFLEVESGVFLNRLVRFTLDQGFAGLEAFLGQPGTVGGAIYINAHNAKKNMFFGDSIFSAKLLTKQGEIVNVDRKYFRFGYDESSIQKSGDIVLSVVIGLDGGDRKELWKQAQEALEYRMGTQPTGVYSLGCTFRNISKSEAIRLSTAEFTCSAGYLLERVGLKGMKKGKASFSPLHANFIVHSGEAKGSDVLELIHLAKRKVMEKFGIVLQEEIVVVGDHYE
ncbi:UDP-N-acetylmuramate dehydrogenase [Candidatus Gottesmanbacteria bacterium]|nr:UDP-N-acetylmuramate dehydrogenase [Candidatus Gottesmanbacteria bacterium]